MKFRASPGISTFGSLIEEPHRVSLRLYYTSRIMARFPGWLRRQRAYDLALVFHPPPGKMCAARDWAQPAL